MFKFLIASLLAVSLPALATVTDAPYASNQLRAEAHTVQNNATMLDSDTGIDCAVQAPELTGLALIWATKDSTQLYAINAHQALCPFYIDMDHLIEAYGDKVRLTILVPGQDTPVVMQFIRPSVGAPYLALESIQGFSYTDSEAQWIGSFITFMALRENLISEIWI